MNRFRSSRYSAVAVRAEYVSWEIVESGIQQDTSQRQPVPVAALPESGVSDENPQQPRKPNNQTKGKT